MRNYSYGIIVYFLCIPFALINHHDNDICQCRNFRFQRRPRDLREFGMTIDDIKEIFNEDLIAVFMNIFRKWYMLQRIFIAFSDNALDYNLTTFNFSDDLFDATELEIFEFTHLTVEYINNSISNWQNLLCL